MKLNKNITKKSEYTYTKAALVIENWDEVSQINNIIMSTRY